jgi:hypothetical protein
MGHHPFYRCASRVSSFSFFFFFFFFFSAGNGQADRPALPNPGGEWWASHAQH